VLLLCTFALSGAVLSAPPKFAVLPAHAIAVWAWTFSTVKFIAISIDMGEYPTPIADAFARAASTRISAIDVAVG
jgi:hypothetical protein